jgi:hypothetical protein
MAQSTERGGPPERPGLRMSEFIASLVKDPKNPPEVVEITGFLGAAVEPGRTRIYLDTTLQNYVEVMEDKILHVEPVEGVSSGYRTSSSRPMRRFFPGSSRRGSTHARFSAAASTRTISTFRPARALILGSCPTDRYRSTRYATGDTTAPRRCIFALPARCGYAQRVLSYATSTPRSHPSDAAGILDTLKRVARYVT